MNQEVKKIADDLISKGKRVFVNEKEELFTEESLAQLSKSKFTEYTNSKVTVSTAGAEAPVKEKPLANMNMAELQAKATSLGIELTEGEIKKDLAAKIQTKLEEIAVAEEDKKKAIEEE